MEKTVITTYGGTFVFVSDITSQVQVLEIACVLATTRGTLRWGRGMN